MKVFLTGATGYVGHQLAIDLAGKGYTVHALVRNLNSNTIPIHDNIKIHKGDIDNYKTVLQVMSGCHYVFHVAAFTDLRCEDLNPFYKVNVEGTKNVLEAAMVSGVERFVFTSTLSVYGPSLKHVPINELQPRLTSYSNHYELTKSVAEKMVESYSDKGLHTLILNVTKVYGPGVDRFSNGVNRLIEILKRKRYLLIPSKCNVVSNYVFIDDVIKGHILALNHGKGGEKYIIGGENLSYNQLFKTIVNVSKSNIKLLKVNYVLTKAVANILGAIMRVFGLNSDLSPKILDALFTYRMSTSRKAIIDLNYRITSFEEGLCKTIQFLNSKTSIKNETLCLNNRS